MLSFLVILWLYHPTSRVINQIASMNLGIIISFLSLICNFCSIVAIYFPFLSRVHLKFVIKLIARVA